jgi:hypothetical protein
MEIVEFEAGLNKLLAAGLSIHTFFVASVQGMVWIRRLHFFLIKSYYISEYFLRYILQVMMEINHVTFSRDWRDFHPCNASENKSDMR